MGAWTPINRVGVLGSAPTRPTRAGPTARVQIPALEDEEATGSDTSNLLPGRGCRRAEQTQLLSERRGGVCHQAAGDGRGAGGLGQGKEGAGSPAGTAPSP